MKIEHVAYIVKDPPAVAAWYVKHLGWTIKRGEDTRPFTHFIADSTGQVMVELYNNPDATVPEYASMHPLVLHLALTSEAIDDDRDRLLAAGCTDLGGIMLNPAGDRLAMMRDPWGMALQLCQRRVPMT